MSKDNIAESDAWGDNRHEITELEKAWRDRGDVFPQELAGLVASPKTKITLKMLELIFQINEAFEDSSEVIEEIRELNTIVFTITKKLNKER